MYQEDPKGFVLVILIGILLTFLAVWTLASCARVTWQ